RPKRTEPRSRRLQHPQNPHRSSLTRQPRGPAPADGAIKPACSAQPSAFCDRLFDAEIRTVVCSTNAIESVNARIRRAVRARGHFPNEAAALKCVYLAVMSLDPTGQGRKRWTMRWKPALNAFEMAFEGRLTAARK
ncbi:transposase, partial [Micromonospora sp. NPDC005206]|uniref:transposase n=1 Tax=Micromonospora sp. NPDC005206 TaxID=3157022 RepID=UPI0033B5E396